MSTRPWPSDAEMDALLEAAAQSKSKALRFDPAAPGGFRALTTEQDQKLIDAIGLPDQRYGEDREHLLRERDDAREHGDLEAAEAAEAHLEVLAAERRLTQRHDWDLDELEVEDEERERDR